jgi:hypothetical protein
MIEGLSKLIIFLNEIYILRYSSKTTLEEIQEKDIVMATNPDKKYPDFFYCPTGRTNLKATKNKPAPFGSRLIS